MSGLLRARGGGLSAALAVLSAIILAPLPAQAQQTALVNGVPLTNLSGPTDSMMRYYIDVPGGSGHLIIETTGGSGDVDIYVGHRFVPDLVKFDCVGWLAGNNERCWFPIPESGRYHIIVHGYAAFVGVQLLARFSDDRPAVRPITHGQQVTVEIPAGTMKYHSFIVEQGSSNLVVEMTGGPDTTGDSELYVRFNAPPVQDEFYWDCRPWIDGNNETCIFENPPPGLWYAGVEAWHLSGDARDVRLVASWTRPDTTPPAALQVARTGARARPVHQLGWTGGGTRIDVWLNGSHVYRGPNTGTYAQGMLARDLPAMWRVCNAGTTAACSGDVVSVH